MRALIFLTFFTLIPTAFAANKHSAVETKVVKSATKANEVAIEFKVMTIGAIVINDASDAPWQLTLKDLSNAKAAQTTFTLNDLDKKLPGYTVKAETSAKDWSASYKLTAFICTKDKSQCYREVHNGVIKGS